jgi:Fe-S oxidoreductase
MGIFGFGSSTLYYPGCYSSTKASKIVSNYKRILKKLGIRFTTLETLNCCTGILINAGYDVEARKIARSNFQILKKKGIKKIITNCPLCYKTFSKDYEEMLPDWNIQVEFILETILDRLRSFRYKNELESKQATYIDSCYLGRYSKFYNQPREILLLLGYKIKELQYRKENTLCSGACGNLASTNPDLANKICQNLIKEIKRANSSTIITADPYSYNHLKNNLTDSGINLLEFSEAILGVIS